MKSRKLFVCLIALVILCSLCSCGLSNSISAKRLEGKGYDSAEDALTAYIKCFESQDVNGMISCFAVESYAENYNLKEQIDFLGGVYARGNSSMPIPYLKTGTYSEKLAVRTRESEVIKNITNQYLALVTDENMNTGLVFSTRDYDENASKLLETIFEYDDKDIFEHFDFDGNFLEPYDLNELYSSPNSQNWLKEQCISIGADNVVSVVAEFEFFGDEYIMSADAVEYNGKWFLLSFNSQIGNLLDMTYYQAGILHQ